MKPNFCLTCHQNLLDVPHEGLNGEDCPQCGQGLRWRYAAKMAAQKRKTVQCEPCQKCATQRAEAQPAQATNSAMAKPHRSVCSHCYGSAEMCGSCDNGSRFYPLCREQGVASA